MKPHPSLVAAAQRFNWQKAKAAKAAEEARQRRIEAEQPVLPGVDPELLCRECHGRGCPKCQKVGTVPGTTCPRCYGTGREADSRLLISPCRKCNGKGKVQ